MSKWRSRVGPNYTTSPQTTVCQYNIDVTEPEELVDNCDLALCVKNLNLDAGDFIKINHRDIQVRHPKHKEMFCDEIYRLFLQGIYLLLF